jgi:uncharacterized protein YjiS (DUF1127 family)
MTIFPLGIGRFPEFFAVHFLRWKRQAGRVELGDLSDRNLQDIGLTRSKPDFDAVKPFWMP